MRCFFFTLCCPDCLNVSSHLLLYPFFSRLLASPFKRSCWIFSWPSCTTKTSFTQTTGNLENWFYRERKREEPTQKRHNIQKCYGRKNTMNTLITRRVNEFKCIKSGYNIYTIGSSCYILFGTPVSDIYTAKGKLYCEKCSVHLEKSSTSSCISTDLFEHVFPKMH